MSFHHSPGQGSQRSFYYIKFSQSIVTPHYAHSYTSKYINYTDIYTHYTLTQFYGKPQKVTLFILMHKTYGAIMRSVIMAPL